jgi:hypothetical protein
MRGPADIAVYDENDQISALVQVKAVLESSSEWAAKIRRDVVERSGFVPRYFLVVARDFAYIWTTSGAPDAMPDQKFETDHLFQDYLAYIKSDSDSIAPSALELMVGIWLNEMTSRADRTADVALEKSGFPSAVANGRVEFVAAA